MQRRDGSRVADEESWVLRDRHPAWKLCNSSIWPCNEIWEDWWSRGNQGNIKEISSKTVTGRYWSKCTELQQGSNEWTACLQNLVSDLHENFIIGCDLCLIVVVHKENAPSAREFHVYDVTLIKSPSQQISVYHPHCYIHCLPRSLR